MDKHQNSRIVSTSALVERLVLDVERYTRASMIGAGTKSARKRMVKTYAELALMSRESAGRDLERIFNDRHFLDQ